MILNVIPSFEGYALEQQPDSTQVPFDRTSLAGHRVKTTDA